MSVEIKKPREFWIYKTGKLTLASDIPLPAKISSIHVIEKSAYDAVFPQIREQTEKFVIADNRAKALEEELQNSREALEKDEA